MERMFGHVLVTILGYRKPAWQRVLCTLGDQQRSSARCSTSAGAQHKRNPNFLQRSHTSANVPRPRKCAATTHVFAAGRTFCPTGATRYSAGFDVRSRSDGVHYLLGAGHCASRDLFETRTNLEIGFQYLRYLLDEYDGDLHLALTAYNRGPGTVNRLLTRGRNPDNGYAGKVLRDRG
jgi:hypothetical protein